jgi:hypothetical protein
MENARPEITEFQWRRLVEECPTWAIGVPVVFAFLVVAIIFLYRQEISTQFKMLVSFIALAGIHTAVGAGMAPGVAKLAWVLLVPFVIFLLLIVSGIVWRRDIMDRPATSAIYLFVLMLGSADLFAMNFVADRTTAPAFLFVLFAFLVPAWLWEVKQQPAALVTAAAVLAISIVYVALGLLLISLFSWMIILIPALAVAMSYVVMMYVKDARSVHFIWAVFLGMLRTTVYLILAVVFLLPGCQHSDKQEHHSKIIMLIDVSGSMFVVDDLVEPGKDPKTLLSRQEKIVRFLTDAKTKPAFFDRVVDKSPLLVGRFGPVLDEIDLISLDKKEAPLELPPKFKNEDLIAAHEKMREQKWKSLQTDLWRSYLNPDKKVVKEPILEGKDEATKKELLIQYTKRRDMIDLLRSGTNIGGACLQMHKLENSSLIQAIIVISDGQSNVGSDDARAQFLDRVNGSKKTIPVITIGVGQFRLPVSIRIDDINAPEEVRPDDPFRVKVPVVSTGIPGEKFKVFLEMQRIEDGAAPPNELKGEKVIVLEPKEGTFKGAGDQQTGTVDFEINLKELTGHDPASEADVKLLLGRWSFKAKVARHEKEPFPEEFHESDPVTVLVQKRPLKILLFCGGATREYQFLRTALYREMKDKRMEFCIYNQSADTDREHIDQDVEPKRMLDSFPDRLGPNAAGTEFMSLSDYDVIVAFDPDWTKLSLNQRKLLNKWVTEQGGGIIFVAGPVYSHQIARPGGENLNDILSIYPVVLKDARLHSIGVGGLGHDASRPYPLIFNPAIKAFDFLKLDEAGKGPVAGWNTYFWGREGYQPGPDDRPRRGFYTYYPVERIKTNTITIAAFGGIPKEARIGEKTDAFKDQMPFIAEMQVGSGKSLFIGSGEFWRLRGFREGYHERLWIKMARHVAPGAKAQKKHGSLIMPRVASIGRIEVDAKIRGKDFNPLDRTVVPTILIRKLEKKNAGPAEDKDAKDAKDKDKDAKQKKEVKTEKKEAILKIDMKAKPLAEGEEWQGDFYGSIVLTEDGEYEFKLPIPGVEGEYLGPQNLIVRKPNPELDNLRTNFGYLYQLASPSDTLLKNPNITAETRKRIEALLQAPDGANIAVGDKASKRLYFPLSSADAITDCLVEVKPKTDTVKGRFEDLWDKPISWPSDWPEWAFWLAVLTPIAISLVPALVLLILKSWQGAIGSFVLGLFVALIPVAIRFLPGREVDIFTAVLVTPGIVGLVGLVILLILRQWISAIGFYVLCQAVSGLALIFVYAPEVAVVLTSGLVMSAALGYGIFLVVKKDYGVAVTLVIAGGLLAFFGVYTMVRWNSEMHGLAESILNDSLQIGFSAVLLIAVSLVGVEWLTRKLLRLA